MLIFLSFLSACHEESLVGYEVPAPECDVETTPVENDEIVDLGFSGNDLRALLGDDPLSLTVTYEDDSLGYVNDTVTFSGTRDLLATRVSRYGSGCESAWNGATANEVLHIAWSSDVTSASGDVNGTASVYVESEALDLSVARFSTGNYVEVTFPESVWDAYFEKFPNMMGAACSGTAGWGGPVQAADWSLSAHCENSETIKSGKWLKGTLAVSP